MQYDFKSTASVFINIIHIYPDKNSTLQEQDQLSPCNWLHASHGCKDGPRMLMEHQTKINENFRKYRYYEINIYKNINSYHILNNYQ